MKCECGYENKPDALFCVGCGKAITAEPAEPAEPIQKDAEAPPTQQQAPSQQVSPPQMHPIPGQNPQMPPPPMPPQMYPPRPPAVMQQPYYTPYPPRRKPDPFTLTDVFIIASFILAICGIFYYAYVLLTASIIMSVIAWRRKTNSRTNGLGIAALIVGICAYVINIASTLNLFDLIPSWLSSGIIKR